MYRLCFVLMSMIFATALISPAYAANCETNPTHPQCGDGGGGAPTSDTYVFAGYSTAVVKGDVGFHGMHGACQSDFGPNARICTTKEALLSPNFTPPGSDETDYGWVQPLPYYNNKEQMVPGLAITIENCGGFTLQSRPGVTIVYTGGLAMRSCSEEHTVSCCVPKGQ